MACCTLKRLISHYNQSSRCRQLYITIRSNTTAVQPSLVEDRSLLPSECDEKRELIRAVTDVYQAQRRLSFLMREKLENNPCAKDAIEKSHHIQEALSNLKGTLEGSKFTFNSIKLPPHVLFTLTPLVTTHTFNYMTQSTRDAIEERLHTLFKGQVKRLLFACVLSCPWYSAVFNELKNNNGQGIHINFKSEKASSYNVLYVVYESLTENFFSLSKRDRELDVINEPPIYACEVREFCASLFACNIQSMEALCSPKESIILESPEWCQFKDLVDPLGFLDMRFFNSCVGQSVGSLTRRPPEGRTSGDLKKYCDSFKWLSYASSAIEREVISPWYEEGEERMREGVKAITSVMKGEVSKDDILCHLVNTKDSLVAKQQSSQSVPRRTAYWNRQMKDWITNIRKEGVTFTPQNPISTISVAQRKLLSSVGLRGIPSDDVIVIAKAGSHMYNLALPTSDEDYIIIYKYPPENIMKNLHMKESLIKRGNNELDSHEARMFCELILKGSVRMFELLYADNLYYTSDHWSQLVLHRDKFLSEHVVSQYSGYIRHHLNKLQAGPSANDSKSSYHAFHKLLSLESFVQGGPPIVTCTGEERDKIMKIRQESGVLQNREEVLSEVKERFLHARKLMRLKTALYPQFTDYKILQSWLLSVRGVSK